MPLGINCVVFVLAYIFLLYITPYTTITRFGQINEFVFSLHKIQFRADWELFCWVIYACTMILDLEGLLRFSVYFLLLFILFDK